MSVSSTNTMIPSKKHTKVMSTPTKKKGVQGQVLAIMLTTWSSKGGDLLFRYPCEGSGNNKKEIRQGEGDRTNPFTVKSPGPLYEVTNQFRRPFGIKDGLVTYSDKVLSNFLAVQPNLSDMKFDAKLDDVQFVGYPVTVHHSQERLDRKNKQDMTSTTIVNVVFALPESVAERSKACYHQLSHQLAMAIKHEERRCCYFCLQKKIMTATIEDVTHQEPQDNVQPCHPSLVMLEKEGLTLPRTLKNVFDKVSERGVVLELMNYWTEINFCLPIKVHNLPFENELRINEEDIDRCLSLIRPYHSMLLLVDARQFINSIVIDCCPGLVRLLKVTNPTKNLQDLAADSDLELSQVFKLVGHLVYWAKATIIYPLCELDVFVLSPNAPIYRKSELVAQFQREFSGELNSNSLTNILAEFSLPLPLGDHHKITDERPKRTEKVKMVCWMLQRRLLIQLHTYLYLKPIYMSWKDPKDSSTITLNADGRKLLAEIDPHNDPLFLRMLHYFDGNHHLEEIMFYMNMSWTELLSVVDKHLPMLYKMQAPDPATSYFAKHCFKRTGFSKG